MRIALYCSLVLTFWTGCASMAYLSFPEVQSTEGYQILGLQEGMEADIRKSESIREDLLKIMAQQYLLIEKEELEVSKNVLESKIQKRCLENGATKVLYTKTFSRSYMTLKGSVLEVDFRSYIYTVFYLVEFKTPPVKLGLLVRTLPQNQLRKHRIESGLLITLIYDESPAEQAKLALGDIILEVNGFKVHQEKILTNLVSTAQSGDILDFLILREGNVLPIPIQIAEGKS
ncbi:MAG: PDZ domain-containing protein [Spirochaetales bacterium]|nr:PDZ domain-containing protein [Spirochaetales bacterium]